MSIMFEVWRIEGSSSSVSGRSLWRSWMCWSMMINFFIFFSGEEPGFGGRVDVSESLLPRASQTVKIWWWKKEREHGLLSRTAHEMLKRLKDAFKKILIKTNVSTADDFLNSLGRRCVCVCVCVCKVQRSAFLEETLPLPRFLLLSSLLWFCTRSSLPL